MTPLLLLASTSPYRRELLQRLQVPFRCVAPNVEEIEFHGEAAGGRALRLALAKAQAVARSAPEAVVIGSDQVASLGGEVLHKPGTAEAARQQLQRLSGQSVRFETAVAVINARYAAPRQHLDTTVVRFRAFDAAEVRRYVSVEPALDCAGGFKAEGLGIALMQSLRSEDPTAIVGLPLIWTADALRAAGFALP